MKVRCIDNRPFLHRKGEHFVHEVRDGKMISLTEGRVYEVISVDRGWYKIVDDTDEA